MQKARRHPSEDGLRPFVSARFQVLLTSLVGVLFNIQSPYWFAIGHQGVFSLGGWALRFHAGFHEPDATLVRLGPRQPSLQDFHLLWSSFPTGSRQPLISMSASTTPPRRTVWAVPISLAATDGIEVSFFSCSYLDVSVYCVSFHTLCIQVWMTPKCRVSPFRNPRINAWLPTPLGLSQAPTSFIAS